MNLRVLSNKAGNFLKDNASDILMWLGIGGVGLTVYTAHQDTLKAEEILYDNEYPDDIKEVIKLTWKCYIPTFISAVSTMGCIGGSHYCSEKTAEGFASAYILSQTTLQEYQRRVVDRIGENKARELREEVTCAVADRQTPISVYSEGIADVIDTGHGTTLFYDVPSKTSFKSDMNYIRSVINDINYELRSEMEFDQNEILYRWGLPYLKYGSEMIVDVDHPLEVYFTPEMLDTGQVRINIDYDLIPRRYNG